LNAHLLIIKAFKDCQPAQKNLQLPGRPGAPIIPGPGGPGYPQAGANRMRVSAWSWVRALPLQATIPIGPGEQIRCSRSERAGRELRPWMWRRSIRDTGQ